MSSSSLNSIYGLNRLRITGMNSGLDTDSIISSLMSIEQMKVDKQFKTMTQKEYKRDDIRSVRTELQNFRLEFMSSSNALKNMLSANNFKAYKVDSSDTLGRATATASSSAASGTHSLDAVVKLAQAASVTGSKVTGDNGKTIDSTDKKLGELVAEGFISGINSTAVTTEIDGEVQPVLDSSGRQYYEGEGTLKFGDVEVKYNANDTLQTVMNKVNSSGAGVTMGFSQLSGKFTLTSKTVGADSEISASDSNGLLESMGFEQTGDSNGFMLYSKEGAQDAEAVIDGYRVTSSKNSFTYDGVTYNVKKTFNEGITVDGDGKVTGGQDEDAITFEVKQDVDKAVNAIKGFVEGYNKLVASLTAKIQEKPDSNYLPLTDDERDQLSESQLTKWETESKKGMLYKDSAISQLLSDMRSAFFSEVEGVGLSLAAIGVAPASSVIEDKYVGTQQDIQIDEDKLRAALERNPEQVAQMFMAGDGLPKSEMKNQGLANKFVKLFNNYRNNTSDIQIASLDYEIDKYDDKLESMKDRMTRQEELLYQKYAAMETALSKMQSQTSSLLSQLGG